MCTYRIPVIYDRTTKKMHWRKKGVYRVVANTKPIPVRLENDLIERLDRVANQIGSNRSAVIRFLVSSWVDEFERTGHAILPPNWEEILAALDGRSDPASPLSVVADNVVRAMSESHAERRVGF